MKVDKSLLPVKAAYFCAFAAVASLLPYLGVFMKQVGLSPTEAAIIYGTMPFIGAIVRTIVGALVDKFCCHKAALVVFCLLSAFLHGCLALISRGVIGHHVTDNGHSVHLTCGHLGSYIEICSESTNCTDGMYCLDSAVNLSRVDDEDLQSLITYFNDSTLITDVDSNCNWTCRTRPICADDLSCRGDIVAMCASNATSSTCDINNGRTIELSQPQLGLSTQISNICTHYTLTSFSWSSDDYTNLTCDGRPANLSCRVSCTSKREPMPRFARPFWTFALILLPAQVAFSPVLSLMDALAYQTLAERRYLWGRQRLWGTIGFGLCAVLSGVWMDAVSDNVVSSDYTPAVVLFAGFQLACAVFVACYSTEDSTKRVTDAPELCVMDKALGVLRIPGVPSLLFLVFAFGAYTGLIETFLYWHLQTIGARPPPQILLGLCMAASCVPEVGVMFAAGWLVSRLGGHTRCLCLVCVAYAIRLISYSALHNAWLTLALEPLHAITFGLMYVVVSAHASQVTPPGLHGIVQGAISAVHFGVGKGIGSVLGGQLFEVLGARVTFRSYGVSAICLLFVYIIIEISGKRFGRQTEQPVEASEEVAEMQAKISAPSMEKVEEEITEEEAQIHGLLEDSKKEDANIDAS